MLDFVFPLRETLVIQVQQSICRQLFICFYYYHIIIGISMGLCIFCSLLLLAFLNRSCVNLSWEITRSIEERQATTEENRREVFFFFFFVSNRREFMFIFSRASSNLFPLSRRKEKDRKIRGCKWLIPNTALTRNSPCRWLIPDSVFYANPT